MLSELEMQCGQLSIGLFINIALTCTMLSLNITCFQNSADPNQLDTVKPADQDLHCYMRPHLDLSILLMLSSMGGGYYVVLKMQKVSVSLSHLHWLSSFALCIFFSAC